MAPSDNNVFNGVRLLRHEMCDESCGAYFAAISLHLRLTLSMNVRAVISRKQTMTFSALNNAGLEAW
jgi:hypothetical protein